MRLPALPAHADQPRARRPHLMPRCLGFVLGWLVWLTAGAASAATITVNNLGDAGVGCTLRGAIANANNGAQSDPNCSPGAAGSNVIELPAGTLTLSAGTLYIGGNNLTLHGTGAGSTIISGGDTQRIFDTFGGGTFSLNLQSLTVQQGFAASNDPDTTNAAALFVDTDVTATVDQCVFQGNVADSSGGAIESWGTLSVSNSSFLNNIATSGSGGAIYSTGNLTISNSTFSGNVAGQFGSAIYTGGNYTVTNSTIDGTVYNAGKPLVSSVSPTAGPIGGGTLVSLTGTGFDGTTKVTFGTTDADGKTVTVTDNEHMTVTAPAHAAGVVHITVTSAAGTSLTSANDQFTYQPAPTVSGLTPAKGPTAGGTAVIVTGTDFTNVSSVTIGGTSTSFSVSSATQMTVTTPARAAGVADLRVTTAGGTSDIVAADRFTYVAPPSISSLAPTAGPTAGGTSVVITGTGLSEASAVSFGGVSATSFTQDSATQITAVSPAGTEGVVHVVVTTPGGDSATGTADEFTYAPTPTVTSVSPAAGPTGGGNSVTIAGTGLTAATAVKFGATNATGFTVNSATQITATVPAGSGIVDVTVTTAGGTSSVSLADKYSYVPAPVVTGINPASGPTAGGTSVVITGSNLTAASAVRFGGTAATSFTVNSSTQITATAPAGAVGAVDVTVTTAGGTSATHANDVFTYVAAPTVTGVSPTAGPVAGGSTVTITGTALTGATAVKFGSANATSFVVDSATQITAVSPAASAGLIDITVTTLGGTSATSASDQFTYVAAPTITGVAPANGPLGGGTSVVITGTGFSGVTSVQFGASSATSFTVNSATQITATSPAASAGTVDIRVTATGGTSATGTADQFTYLAAPSISAVSPNSGPSTGGTTVVLSGGQFVGVSAVKFGANNASSFTVNSPTQITATAPAGTAGMVNLTVTAAGGTSTPSANDQFSYVAAPALTGIAPSSGPLAGGTSVTLTGTDLSGATAVKFGANNATSFTVNSATQITATTPTGVAGTVDVTVTAPGGTSATHANARFTYAGAPTVLSLTPASGPVAGGSSVVLTGTGFTGASVVKFGTTNATSFTVDSATRITATAPAGAAGTVNVLVTTPGGTSAAEAANQFSYIAAPTISQVSPARGSTLGGTEVVITGTHLTAASEVRFGATAATRFTVDSATRITAVAPVGAAGVVDITVVTAGGSSALHAGDQFTYDAKTFTGSLPGGGSATASFTGGGAGCGFATAQFVPAANPPAGLVFRQGLFDFRLAGCTAGQPIEMTLSYATAPGSTYWKFGPTAARHENHWYQMPGATFSGTTVRFSITDGGLGDDDLAANGEIVDAGGPATPQQIAAIPSLSDWALAILAGLMLLLARAGFAPGLRRQGSRK